jgi:hypothetical protein
MVLSGTDYNIHSNTCLKETIRWYTEYSKTNKNIAFYDWLVANTKYIRDFESLKKIYNLFQLEMDEIEKWKSFQIIDKRVDEKKLRQIMEKEGFIFKP